MLVIKLLLFSYFSLTKLCATLCKIFQTTTQLIYNNIVLWKQISFKNSHNYLSNYSKQSKQVIYRWQGGSVYSPLSCAKIHFHVLKPAQPHWTLLGMTSSQVFTKFGLKRTSIFSKHEDIWTHKRKKHNTFMHIQQIS